MYSSAVGGGGGQDSEAKDLMHMLHLLLLDRLVSDAVCLLYILLGGSVVICQCRQPAATR